MSLHFSDAIKNHKATRQNNDIQKLYSNNWIIRWVLVLITLLNTE